MELSGQFFNHLEALQSKKDSSSETIVYLPLKIECLLVIKIGIKPLLNSLNRIMVAKFDLKSDNPPANIEMVLSFVCEIQKHKRRKQDTGNGQ